MSSEKVDKFGIVGKKHLIWITLAFDKKLTAFHSSCIGIRTLVLIRAIKHQIYPVTNDPFAIINTQPSKMQVEHWNMMAKFQHPFDCRFTWSQRLQFPEEALPMVDSRAVAGTSQRLWILHDLCCFFLQVRTGRNFRGS